MRALLRPSLVLLVLAILAGSVVYALRSPQGLPSIRESQRKVHEMEHGNEEIRQQILEMQQRIERVRTSREAQDEEIRRHTLKQKPGETTVILPPSR